MFTTVRPLPKRQPHPRYKGPRSARIDRSRAGRRKYAAGILQPRCRIDAVGDVVGGCDIGLVEQVLDLEEEDRALQIGMIDFGVVVDVDVEEP